MSELAHKKSRRARSQREIAGTPTDMRRGAADNARKPFVIEGSKKMGTFRVGCRIENIADRNKSAVVDRLLVDTGSDYTWLPATALEKIGVKREKKDVTLTMANGQQITRTVGFVIVRSDQFFTVDEVVFAEPGDMLLLGARTLEGFNARVDPKQKKLVTAGPLLAAEVGKA